MRHIEEHDQICLLTWSRCIRIDKNDLPVPKGAILFDYMVASANGGSRNKREAARMKRTGVKAGFPDVSILLPSKQHSGLFIELKRAKANGVTKGRVTEKQKEWIKRLNEAGYLAVICYGFDDAKAVILEYLSAH